MTATTPLFTRLNEPACTEPQLFGRLHPEIAAWFRQRFGALAPAQLYAIPEILAGHSLLLTSPTGSGKTLAAFLGVFHQLVLARDAGALPRGIFAVYVSPLRALAYDLQKNLQQPLAELGWDWLRVAARTGDTTPSERAAQRRKPPHILVTTPESLTLMLSQPAWTDVFRATRFLIADELHALAENKRGAMLMVAAERLEELVTVRETGPTATATPRPAAQGDDADLSSEVVARASSPPTGLNSAATRRPAPGIPEPDRLCRVGGWASAVPDRTQPVPPDGAPPSTLVAGDATPSSRSIALLADGTERAPPAHATRLPSCNPQSAIANLQSPLVRIGLSATVAPLETVAEFLVGPGRPCRIAEITQRKPARIEVFSPLREHAYPPAGYTATRVLRELGALLAQRDTTLIFTNTRSGAESIGLRLKQLLPELNDLIEVHHASLDRSVRLQIEDRLKRGELRAVVCSTSLEMGIDIGSIDLVVMVSAPKGVARALQRIGRSGHSMGRISHGVLVASNINDLAECAVTARMMTRRELEPVKVHENPLDVLAQTLVGLAVFGSTTPDEAFALVRRSYPYRRLERAQFDRVLRYLRGGGVSLERNYEDLFGKVRVDAGGHLVLPHPRVARSFYQNIGTINTESMVQVRLKRRNLGQVEESFMKAVRPGDVFVLNGRCVRLVKTHLLTADVVAADNAVPTIPRWYANKMPLASGLATEVVRLRTEVARRLADEGTEAAKAFLTAEYDLSAANARALVEHFRLQAEISAIPTAGRFLVEVFREGDYVHVFFHALIGRSANDALSRLVAQRVQETKGGNALVTIDDYGFLLSLRSFQAMTPAELRALFRREGAEEALRAALAEASLVKWQFRGVAQTGLMVPRRVHGTERGSRMLQWSSEIIFEVLRQHEPDHPLLVEAYAEATLRFLDLPRALEFLERLPALPWDVRELTRVSPFSFGIYVSKIKETMTLEDPETTIERLYHAMYGSTGAPARAPA